MINIKEILGLTYYTSKLDQFLSDFNKTHPKLSLSQRAEIAKYENIYRLRDNPSATAPVNEDQQFWDKF